MAVFVLRANGMFTVNTKLYLFLVGFYSCIEKHMVRDSEISNEKTVSKPSVNTGLVHSCWLWVGPNCSNI